MNRIPKKFQFKVLSYLILLFFSSILLAGQTDAEIRNYSEQEIAIEYRVVTIGGQVKWEPIGSIPKKSAKIFRNITIGSVIRAKGNNLAKEFTINSPPSGKNQVVLKVK